MMRVVPVLLILIGLSGVAAAVPADSDVAATVNGETISRIRLQEGVDAFLRQGQMSYGGITRPEQFQQVQRQVLEQLIAQELLWQEAKQEGYVASAAEVDAAQAQVRRRYPSERAYMNELKRNGFTQATYREDLKRRLSVSRWARAALAEEIAVSEAEVHEFYVANRARFVLPEQINTRHVLIAVGPDADEATVAAARGKIEQVREQARSGADFAELAREHSQDASAARDGELGFLARDALVKPFADAAFALEPGEISDIVRTRFGFHLIKLEARRPGGIATEQQAAAAIGQYLSSSKLQEVLAERARTLREQGSVEIMIPL